MSIVLPPLPPLSPNRNAVALPPPPSLGFNAMTHEGLRLPAIVASMPSRASHTAEVTNPGDSMPQNQQFASADQSMGVNSFSSGIAQQSDGQFQHRDLSPGQQGVTVTSSSASVKNSTGQFQRKNLKPTDDGVTSQESSGLVETFDPAKQNVSRPIHTTAAFLPPAISVDAGRRGVGGIASNVNIR